MIMERKSPDGKASRLMQFEFEPPKIYVTRKLWSAVRGRTVPTQVRHRPAEARALYWYLEGKLKAIHYGLVDMETEMLGQMLIPDPVHQGEVRTMASAIKENLSRALPIRLQLEEKPNT